MHSPISPARIVHVSDITVWTPIHTFLTFFKLATRAKLQFAPPEKLVDENEDQRTDANTGDGQGFWIDTGIPIGIWQWCRGASSRDVHWLWGLDSYRTSTFCSIQYRIILCSNDNMVRYSISASFHKFGLVSSCNMRFQRSRRSRGSCMGLFYGRRQYRHRSERWMKIWIGR